MVPDTLRTWNALLPANMNHIIAVDEAILFYTAILLEGKVAKYTRGADAPRPAPPPRSPCPTVPNPPSPSAVLRLCGGVGGGKGGTTPRSVCVFCNSPYPENAFRSRYE